MENNLHEIKISEVKNLHSLGRNGESSDGALALFWTASGFSVNYTGGELWAELEGDWSNAEPWASVWIDDYQVSRFIVQKGKNNYCIFRGLAAGAEHKIALLKETQAMSSDSEQMILVHSLKVPDSIYEENKSCIEKLFIEHKAPSLKLEFIGDSVTTGEGLAGNKIEMDWITGWMALKDNYAILTSKKLNAELRVFSQCGWGVTSSWDNDRNCVIPNFYEKVCGLVFGKRNESFGAQNDFDFSSYRPDYIIVNLGTNDWGAFNSPARKNPQTGEEWKYHLDKNKKPVKEDLKHFTDGVYSFLEKLRKCNPTSKIIWAYGMVSYDLGNSIKMTVARFAKEQKDLNVHFIKLPAMSEESEDEKGSRGHPGPATHFKAYKKIVKEIQKLQK